MFVVVMLELGGRFENVEVSFDMKMISMDEEFVRRLRKVLVGCFWYRWFEMLSRNDVKILW